MQMQIELVSLLVAVFGLFLTVVGQALYVAKCLGKLEEKIINIEKKQDKHNNVIERTYKNESDIKVLNEKVDVANHRIFDLERIER